MPIPLIAAVLLGSGILGGARTLQGRRRDRLQSEEKQRFAQSLLDANSLLGPITGAQEADFLGLAATNPSMAVQLLQTRQKADVAAANRAQDQAFKFAEFQLKLGQEQRAGGRELRDIAGETRAGITFQQSQADRAQTQDLISRGFPIGITGGGGAGGGGAGAGQQFVQDAQGNFAGVRTIPGTAGNRELETAQQTTFDQLQNTLRISELGAALTADQLLDPSNPLTAELQSRQEVLGGQIREGILMSGVPSPSEIEMQLRVANDPTSIFSQLTKSKGGALATLANVERIFGERLANMQTANQLEVFPSGVQQQSQDALGRIGQAFAPFQRVQQEAERFGVANVADARQAIEDRSSRAAAIADAQMGPAGRINIGGFAPPVEAQTQAEQRLEMQRVFAAEQFLRNRPRGSQFLETGDPVLDATIRSAIGAPSAVLEFIQDVAR